MKLLLIILALLFVLSGCATVKQDAPPVQAEKTQAYIWPDGFNPYQAILKWEQMITVSIQGLPVVFFKNPDKGALIQCSALVIYYDLVIAYLYLKDGYAHFYWFNESIADYQSMDCDQDQWLKNFRIYCQGTNWQES